MTSDRLLLVEDDATTREVLTLLLEVDGWQVRSAGSGEAALHDLREANAVPSVILCDLHLPGLQGTELAGAIRPLAQGAALLAMSASDPGDAASAYDGVLRKPFGAADLRSALTSMSVRSSANPKMGNANSGTGELPVIATEVLLRLEQQMGARARDLYAFALADAGDRLRRMEQSAKAGDFEMFRKEAHAVKGSAGMIGAQQLAKLAADAETMEGASQAGSWHETVLEMRSACDQIRLMLETLFPI